MIIYNQNVNDFISDCGLGPSHINCIAEKIRAESIKKGYPVGNSDGEQESWTNSLPEVAKALMSPLIDKNLDVAVEYKFDVSRKRVDFLIYGKSDSDQLSVVIIELKQWSETIKRSALSGYVYTFGGGKKEDDHLHPSIQAYNYAETIRFFDEFAYQNNLDVEACSYLHNLVYSALINDKNLFPVIAVAPVFLKGDKDKVTAFIHKYITKPDKHLLTDLDESRVVPSKAFSQMLYNAIEGNPIFTCDPEQFYSIEKVVSEVNDSVLTGKKKTIIIKGGPGTGKSVVAVNILGKLIHPEKDNKKCNAFYLTANYTPRTVMAEDLIGNDYKKTSITNLFKGPGVLKNSGTNEYDCILVDEAHRLMSWKFGFGIKRDVNFLEKVIKSSLVNVFFIDPDQRISSADYVTEELIKDFAYKANSIVIEGERMVLTSEFRCAGGFDYINFITSFLGYENGLSKYHPGHYDFKVFDSPTAMLEAIKKKQEKYGTMARMLSGYTHEWISEKNDSAYDFVYPNGLKLQWNKLTTKAFVNDDTQLDRVGCIHTVQGADLQYAAVIIGKDMVYRNGHIVFDKKENVDPRTGISSSIDEEAEILIRNTYKVLLTRGILGTYVYCEDEELGKYLKGYLI